MPVFLLPILLWAFDRVLDRTGKAKLNSYFDYLHFGREIK